MYDEHTNWTEVIQLWEEYQQNYHETEIPNIKKQAVTFLKKTIRKKITRRDLRRLSAKINKMRNSIDKLEKARGQRLYHDLQQFFKSNG